jgi:stage V sporulation protein S
MDTLDNTSVLKVGDEGYSDGQNGTHDGALDTAMDTPHEVIHDDTEVLKVSAHSRPSAVAGAIAAVIRHQGRADVQAIGAGATNQAIKAVAIARDYLQPDGIDIVVIPAFIDVMIANEERTAIRLVVESRVVPSTPMPEGL